MNIKEIVSTINEMQTAGVIGQYAIGGAVAATFYMDEPDTTDDVDVYIVLNPAPGQLLVSLDPIHNYLAARGFQLDAEGYSVLFDWKVQFLPADKPLLKEALEQSVERDLEGVPMRIFSAEHLAAIAFELGRPKDKLRLPRFLEAKLFNESRFSEIIERHGLLDRWVKFRKQILD
jgi:hypothetical protein